MDLKPIQLLLVLICLSNGLPNGMDSKVDTDTSNRSTDTSNRSENPIIKRLFPEFSNRTTLVAGCPDDCLSDAAQECSDRIANGERKCHESCIDQFEGDQQKDCREMCENRWKETRRGSFLIRKSDNGSGKQTSCSQDCQEKYRHFCNGDMTGITYYCDGIYCSKFRQQSKGMESCIDICKQVDELAEIN